MTNRTTQSQKPKAKSEQRTANSQQQIAVMLELLRSAVLDRDPVLDSAVKVDWDKLMAVSQDHGLLAWVWDGICKLPKEQQPERQTRIGWAISAQNIWDAYDRQVDVLDNIVRKCAEKEIRVLLLKGIGLSNLYSKPKSRPSCDIDIYTFDKCEETVSLLTTSQVRYGVNHFMFQYRGENIECHDHLLSTRTSLQQKVQIYINSTLGDCTLSTLGFYELPMISNTVYVLMHILSHFVNPGPDPLRIRSILDYGMLLIKIREQGKVAEYKKLLCTLELECASDLFVRLSEWILQVDLSDYYCEVQDLTNDMEKSKELLFDEKLRHPIFDEKSFVKQLYQRLVWHKAVRWRYSYLPSSERLRLPGKIQFQFHIFVKSLLGLPFDEPLLKSIKEKRKK